MIVLDPRQVPDQPGDRISVGADPVRQLCGAQAIDGVADGFPYPAERVH